LKRENFETHYVRKHSDLQAITENEYLLLSQLDIPIYYVYVKNNKIFLKKTEKEIESNFALYFSKNDILKYLIVAPGAGSFSGV